MKTATPLSRMVLLTVVLASCTEAPSPAGPAVPVDAARPVTGTEGTTDTDMRITPYTVIPVLQNTDEVERNLRAEYPPVLREAGVAGNTLVWIFIDTTGAVTESRVYRSSGHDALDQAALRVADGMRYSPARNREEPVGVWVQVPITFGPKRR